MAGIQKRTAAIIKTLSLLTISDNILSGRHHSLEPDGVVFLPAAATDAQGNQKHMYSQGRFLGCYVLRAGSIVTCEAPGPADFKIFLI